MARAVAPVHKRGGRKISTYLRSDKNLTPEAATALDEVIKATYEHLRSRE